METNNLQRVTKTIKKQTEKRDNKDSNRGLASVDQATRERVAREEGKVSRKKWLTTTRKKWDIIIGLSRN